MAAGAAGAACVGAAQSRQSSREQPGPTSPLARESVKSLTAARSEDNTPASGWPTVKSDCQFPTGLRLPSPTANGEPKSPERERKETQMSEVEEEKWKNVRTKVLVEQGLGDDAGDENAETVPFVDKRWFDVAIGFVIILNAIMIGVETDHRKGKNQDHIVFVIFENCFTCVWVFEMLARMYYHHLRYFRSGWNLLDFFLVGLSVMDTWVMPAVMPANSGGNLKSLSILRLVRILRMLRLLRLIRLMKMFKELWLIVNGFIDSLKTLSWVLLLLSIILYVGGIFMTLLVGHSCADGDSYGGWADCHRMFGNVLYSMYTLFQVLTLESWSMAVARPVIEVQPGLLVFFIVFLFLTTFGLLNIIVGVICENVLQAAKQNDDMQARRRRRHQLEELDRLREIFVEADRDGSQCIDREEFKKASQTEQVQNAFRNMEVPLDEPEALFDILDEDGRGELPVDAFILGAMKMKGPPSSLDMKAMAVSVKGINSKFRNFQDNLETVRHKLQALVDEPVDLVLPQLPPQALSGDASRSNDLPLAAAKLAESGTLDASGPSKRNEVGTVGDSTGCSSAREDQSLLSALQHETRKLVEQSMRVQRLLIQAAGPPQVPNTPAKQNVVMRTTDPKSMRWCCRGSAVEGPETIS